MLSFVSLHVGLFWSPVKGLLASLRDPILNYNSWHFWWISKLFLINIYLIFIRLNTLYIISKIKIINISSLKSRWGGPPVKQRYNWGKISETLHARLGIQPFILWTQPLVTLSHSYQMLLPCVTLHFLETLFPVGKYCWHPLYMLHWWLQSSFMQSMKSAFDIYQVYHSSLQHQLALCLDAVKNKLFAYYKVFIFILKLSKLNKMSS